MKDKKVEKKVMIVLGSILIFYVLIIFITNLFHFNYKMNSDIASDVILGRLICNSRKIIPDTWYVANELRIICTPNIAALFFGLTGNMVLASGLACCTMTLLILVSILYFCKAVNIEKVDGMMMGILCLALPASFIMLELLYLFASYYAIHVVILFFTLSMYALYIKMNYVNRQCVWGIIFALILGLQGVRGILVIYGPLLVIELIRNIFKIYKSKDFHFNINISLWVILMVSASFIGTLFPFSVGQGFSRNIRKGFPKLFTVVIPDIGRAIGFESANLLGKICIGMLLLLSFYVLVNLLYRMYKREFIEPIEWAWLMLCCSPVLTAVIVAFTTVESTERYYFVLLFLLPLTGVLIWKKGNTIAKSAIGAIAVILVIANIKQVYLPVLLSKEPPDTEQYQVVQYLEKNNLPIAYATFENANSMTVISNGQVNIYSVASMERMDICKWMTSTEWYCPNVPFEQRTAYIVTEAEKEDFDRFLVGKEKQINEVNKIGKYYIYVADANYSNLGM